ncbi:T9SS type A sorting domain-containing protein [Urechidicola sp. KH5]
MSFSAGLSTDSQYLSSGVSVSSNPFESILTVKNSYQTEIENITVFDLAGRTVQYLKINDIQEEINVDLSTLDTAIYMVNIRLQNGSVVKRVIKR